MTAAEPTAGPTPVPQWPCPTIRITAEGRVQVDGVAVPVPDGVGPDGVRRWAVTYIARQHERLGRPIRVTAVEPDGTRRLLIVHPDGTSVEAPDPEHPGGAGRQLRPVGRPVPPGRRASPARGLTAASAVAAGTLTLGLLALIATSGGHHPRHAPQPPVLPPRAAPPAADLRLPPPPGWSSRARWVVALAPHSLPAVAADGTTAVLTDHRRLAVLDPATGLERWSTPLPAGAEGTLMLTRIDDIAVAALVGGSQLSYWPVDGPDHPLTTVALPDQAIVTLLGTSPLVALPDRAAGVITHGTLRTLHLPAGATALAADGTTVTAATPKGRWTTLTPGHSTTRLSSMAPPTRGARLLRVVGIDGHRLAAVWADHGQQHAVVYDTTTGHPLADGTAPGGLDQATSCAATGLVALGPLVLDTATHTAHPGPTAVRCAAAADHLYVQDSDQTWYDVTAVGVTSLPPGGAPPVGIAAGHALVVADTPQQHLLYALRPGHSHTDSRGPTAADGPQPPGQG